MKKKFIFSLIIFIVTFLVPILFLKIIEKRVDNPNTDINKSSYIITVYDSNKKQTFDIEMEEYLKGVVAAEMPGEFDLEALKAQAVTARTYLLHRLKKYKTTGHPDHPEAAICTSVHCQAWHSIETIKSTHSTEWINKYWSKIETAVDSTRGQILVYNNKIVEPLFHSTSGGRTENSEDVFSASVPYLRSVDSPYEGNAPKLHSTVTVSIDYFITTMNNAFNDINLTSSNLKDKIKLIDVSEGGKVKKLSIDNKEISGREIRALFNLNSTNFKFIQSSNEIEILTTGYGHGVGMSQWGANGMAQNGSDYLEILKHYYTGIEIKNMYK